MKRGRGSPWKNPFFDRLVETEVQGGSHGGPGTVLPTVSGGGRIIRLQPLASLQDACHLNKYYGRVMKPTNFTP